MSLTNCGHEVEFEAPPARIVTIKSSATEAVLALGAGDRLVGTAAADGPVPAALSSTAPPVLSSDVPSAEAVLAVEPDLVYAGWESNLTARSAGDRDRLASLGVGTYVSPAACEDPRFRPTPLRFDDVFAEITEMGSILGEDTAATRLVSQQRTRLSTVKHSGSGRTALWYSSGKTTPYVGGGTGAPQMIMDAVGLTNVASGVEDSWTSMSWEAVTEANPDLIVLVDASWSPAETKIKLLRSNKLTANLAAVKNDRFVTVDFAATQPGVRNVDAAAELAEQLDERGATG